MDFQVAKPFDEAYFCTLMSGQDPTTCTDYTAWLRDQNSNTTLSFSGTNASCLYLGSTEKFRGVSTWLWASGSGANLQWDYWNGASWTSLETGAFEDYNFQWDGFAYWPDDPAGWATRQGSAGNWPAAPGGATQRYYVRVCRAGTNSAPTERLVTRADVSVASRYNLARDKTGLYNSLWRGVGVTGVESTAGPVGAGVNFTSATDLHIRSTSAARDVIADVQRQDTKSGVPGRESSALTGRFAVDIDLQGRPPGANGACFASATACWDIGADEYGAPTAVRLMSFSAVAGDGSVALEWHTGSELDNLGFHVYRGPSADGPWTRLTSSLIPGLGSSPLGQAYSWLDSALVNGVRYYYRLEDVDTASVSTFHGPVSAIPSAAPSPPGEGGGGGGGGGAPEGGGEGTADGSCPSWILAAAPDAVSPTCTRHGDPDAVSLQVLARGASSATVELRTGGFWVLQDAAGEVRGEVRVFVPGLDFPSDPKAPALPLRRALVDAVVGKQVRLVSAEAFGLQSFPGLRPSAVGHSEMALGRDGTVRPGRRAVPARFLSRGMVPSEVARLAGTVFQGERKSAVVEMTPVRFSGSRNELVLAARVRVKLSFAGVAAGEVPTGGGGRVLPRKGQLREVLAQLHTTKRGLYAVRYEELFPTDRRGVSTTLLRLQRQGEAVPFQVRPPGPVFGPGSVLYFYADRAPSSTEYSSEVAYELVRGSGVRMALTSAPPLSGPSLSPSTGLASFETNRVYQPGLLEAPDIWLWDGMASGVVRAKGFTLSGVDGSSSQPARLVVYLQGGSESGFTTDHHVQVSVNGGFVGEATFSGKRPYSLEVSVPASLLQEGANELVGHERGGHGGELSRVPGPVRAELPAGVHGTARAVRGGVGGERDGGGRGPLRPPCHPEGLRSARSRRIRRQVAHRLPDDGLFRSLPGGGGLSVHGRLSGGAAFSPDRPGSAFDAEGGDEPGGLPGDRAAGVPGGGAAASGAPSRARGWSLGRCRSRRSRRSSGTASRRRRRSGRS